MRGLFNYDGPLITFFSKIGDCVLLSVLWVLFSLPVITLGAATTALYHGVRKVLKEDQNGLFSHFWEGFRDNFKQSTLIWLVVLAILAVLGLSGRSAWILFEAGQITKLPLILLGVVYALVIIWILYLFPCVDRFESTVGRILRSCAQVAGLNLLWSLMLLLIFVLAVVLAVWLPVGLLVAPGAAMFASCQILEHVFKKYMDEDASEEGAVE